MFHYIRRGGGSPHVSGDFTWKLRSKKREGFSCVVKIGKAEGKKDYRPTKTMLTPSPLRGGGKDFWGSKGCELRKRAPEGGGGKRFPNGCGKKEEVVKVQGRVGHSIGKAFLFCR